MAGICSTHLWQAACRRRPRVACGCWSPLLARLGEPVHVGPVPNGSALKQVLNAANAPMVALLAEAVVLGERLGLDRALLLDELERSRIGALIRRKRAMVETGRY